MFDGSLSYANRGFRPYRGSSSYNWKQHPTLADVERDPDRYIHSMPRQVRSIQISIEGHKCALRVPRHIAENVRQGRPFSSLSSGHSRSESSNCNNMDQAESAAKSCGDGNSAPINNIDPIMLCELEEHQFHFVRANGAVVAYNVESLVDYMLATGQFCEPETRLEFNDTQLEELDRLAKTAGLDKPSVLYARHNTDIFAESYFKRDALLGLERCLGEIVNRFFPVYHLS